MSLVQGFLCAKDGILLACRDPAVSRLQRKTIRSLFITLALTYVALVWLVFPLQLVTWLLASVLPRRLEENTKWFHILLDADTYSELKDRFTVIACLRQVVWFIPFVVLIIIRYIVGGYEEHFFCILQQQDKKLHDMLVPLRPMSLPEILARQSRRLLRLAWRAVLMYLLWVFPTICFLTVPLVYTLTFPELKKRQRVLAVAALGVASFSLFQYRGIIGHFLLMAVYGFSRMNKYFQASGAKERLIVLAVCGVFATSFLQRWALTVMNISITTTALSIELLDPYLVRARLDDRQLRKLVNSNRFLLLGYGVPLVLLVSMPLLGLTAWGYIQASAACLVAKMANVEINAQRATLKCSD